MTALEKARQPSVHAVPARYLETFWSRVQVRDPEECWPWALSLGSHGYGQACWGIGDGRSAGTTAHRVAWLVSGGQLLPGETVDHECHNRDQTCPGGVTCPHRQCCNPAHLRILHNVDNARGNGQARKAHCPRGHPYAGANLYVGPRGDRRCRRCAQLRKGIS